MYTRPLPARNGRRMALVAAFLGPALLATACQEEGPWRAPLAPSLCGRIEGVVTGPFGPLAAEVWAEQQAPRSDYRARVHTDAAGRFSVLAPYGEFLLRVDVTQASQWIWYAGPGATAESAEAEILTLSPQAPVARAHVRLGGVRIQPVAPGTIRSARCWLELFAWEGWQWDRRSSFDFLELPAAGPIELNGVAPGMVRLSFRSSLADGTVWAPGYADSALAPMIEVRPDAITEVELELAEPAELRGAITGSTLLRAGLGGTLGTFVEVDGWTADSVRVLAAVTYLRDDGSISCRSLTGGRVRLLVACGQWTRWLGGESFGTAPFFDVRPGEVLDLPPIVDAGIFCRLEPPDTTALVEARVKLYDALGGLLWEDATCGPYGFCLNPPGNLVCFTGLSPGRYYLRVSGGARPRGRWLTRWYPSARAMEEATPVDLSAPGEVALLDWALVEGGVIEGWLRQSGEKGEIVLYAEADTLDPVDGSISCRDDEQWFRFAGLEDGAYLMALRTPVVVEGYLLVRNWWYPGAWDASSADRLPVREHRGPEAVRWLGPPESRRARGWALLGGARAPVAGRTAELP